MWTKESSVWEQFLSYHWQVCIMWTSKCAWKRVCLPIWIAFTIVYTIFISILWTMEAAHEENGRTLYWKDFGFVWACSPHVQGRALYTWRKDRIAPYSVASSNSLCEPKKKWNETRNKRAKVTCAWKNKKRYIGAIGKCHQISKSTRTESIY